MLVAQHDSSNANRALQRDRRARKAPCHELVGFADARPAGVALWQQAAPHRTPARHPDPGGAGRRCKQQATLVESRGKLHHGPGQRLVARFTRLVLASLCRHMRTRLARQRCALQPISCHARGHNISTRELCAKPAAELKHKAASMRRSTPIARQRKHLGLVHWWGAACACEQ